MPEDALKRVSDIADRYSWETSTGWRGQALTANEVYNLSIRKGTLTPEERGIINEHIKTSIRMLQSLPYPKNLQNVPIHAGSHHEYYNGKGYPMGLEGNKITLQGRILAIADIFEALTSTDRPYKKTKKLSEALSVLCTMKDKREIDPDLYNLFVREKIYLRYAKEFLAPDQIDLT
jgi:HD-GYP domain-containing protein (c-di-GMP phosphodiesterase class II)